MRQQCHVPPVADLIGDGTIVERIFEGGGGDRTVKLHSRFQQRRLEGQHGRAVGTSSFREQDDRQTGGDRRAYLIYSKSGSQRVLAIDKDCTCGPRQPAKEGPSCDIVLGNKNARSNRAKHDDVEIAKVITDEQTGCGHRTACRYANRKHPACEATPAMKPRPARAKTPRPRKEPNTDRGLNERVAREKPDRESPPNSKKRRVHLCSCSRVRRPRSLRGNTASRGGIIDPGHSGSDAGSRRNIHHFKLPGSAPFQFLNWTGMWQPPGEGRESTDRFECNA